MSEANVGDLAEVDETAKSPTLSARRAGSGAMRPIDSSPRPLLAIGMEDGALFTPDIDVPVDAHVVVALANIPMAISLARQQSSDPDGSINAHPDVFLSSFIQLLDIARSVLADCPPDREAHDDRVRSRELIENLRGWGTRSAVLRSGRAVEGLTVSENVVAAANELARLGQRLRLHREEAMRRQQPQGPRGPIGEEQLEERQSGPTTILELNQLTDDDVRAAIAGERHVKALIWALRQTDDWLKAMDLIDAGWPKSTIQRWANKRNIERRVKPVQYGRARLCEFAWSRWRSE